ncbi:MAG: hypothetical protein WDO73_02455 [Ignavibacteriota bacterium]
MKTTMVELLSPIHERLNVIDTRLDAIDGRLDAVDARFDRQDDYLLRFRSEVMGRFDVIDQRLDFLASSFNKLDMQVPPLNRAVVDFGILAGQFAPEQMVTKERDADIVTRIARLEDQVSKLMKPAA